MKRVCSKCKKPILKNHKWTHSFRRFLFWTFTSVSHRDCYHPTLIHKNVIKVEEPQLPFHEQSGPIVSVANKMTGEMFFMGKDPSRLD